MKLTLKPTIGSATHGLPLEDIRKNPVQYEVVGMPPGQEARIGRFTPHPDRWRILRIIDGKQGEWEGSYDTAEQALATLEKILLPGLFGGHTR